MAYIPQFDPKRDLPNLEVVSEKRSTVLIGTTGTAAITGTTSMVRFLLGQNILVAMAIF